MASNLSIMRLLIFSCSNFSKTFHLIFLCQKGVDIPSPPDTQHQGNFSLAAMKRQDAASLLMRSYLDVTRMLKAHHS